MGCVVVSSLVKHTENMFSKNYSSKVTLSERQKSLFLAANQLFIKLKENILEGSQRVRSDNRSY